MSTERKIQDFLHFYLGQKAIHPALKNPHPISGAWLDSMKEKEIKIKPILRPLSDMTGKEIMEVFQLSYADAKYTFGEYENVNNNDFGWRARNQNGMECFVPANSFKPEVFRWLLSKGIDLFNLIPDDLAINKTTLKP